MPNHHVLALQVNNSHPVCQWLVIHQADFFGKNRWKNLEFSSTDGEVSSRRSRDSLLADLDSIEASWKTTGENSMQSRSSVEVILLHIHQDPLGSSKYPIK